MLVEDNNTKDLKLYSQVAINLATFLGGPLAAGYLIRANYLSFNEPHKGRQALLIGIAATVVLFTTLFMIPEAIVDKIPIVVIPATYTVIIYFIVERIQGDRLNQHQEAEGEFYSRWKAAGVGLLSLIILLIGIFGYSYFAINAEYSEYDSKIAQLSKNETETLA